MAVLLLMQDKPMEADPHFQQVALRKGDHPIGRMFAMANAMPPEAVDRRERYYRAALALEPDNRDGLFLLGTLLTDLRRFQEAKVPLRKFVQFVPDYAPALAALAAAQSETGELDQARANVAAALRADPSYVPARMLQQSLKDR